MFYKNYICNRKYTEKLQMYYASKELDLLETEEEETNDRKNLIFLKRPIQKKKFITKREYK